MMDEEVRVLFIKMEERVRVLEDEVKRLRHDLHTEYMRNIPGSWGLYEEPLEDRMDR